MTASRSFPSALATAVALVLTACGGPGGAEAPDPVIQTYVVDAHEGSDANPGSTAEPFKTLTHALAAAGPGATLEVRPGLYDEAHGEQFPLRLRPGQRLLGNIDARGLGPVPTTIAGQGRTASGLPATLLMAHGAWLLGFEIRGASSPDFHYGIQLRGVNARIENNTFAGPMFGGVYAEHPTGTRIARNDFFTTAYGTHLTAAQGTVHVSHNRFHTPARGIRVENASENVQIHGNDFRGAHQVGVSVAGGSPRLRGNTFRSLYAVEVDGGAPNLGTPGDPGRNDFSGASGTPLRHTGPAAIPAVGNTWPSSRPAAGRDIQIVGSGAVIWGDGQGEHYGPPPPFASR